MNPTDPSEALERKQSVAGVFHRASATKGTKDFKQSFQALYTLAVKPV